MADDAIDEAPETPDTPIADETPVEEAASEAPSSDTQIDWEKRYNDLRPEWDRAKTQLSEFEQYQPLIQSLQTDPRATIAALQEQFGDEYEDDEDDYEDPGERALRLIQEQQETAQQQAERERLEEMEEQYVGEGIDALAERDNVELSDHAQAVIYALATNDALRGENGRPDVEAAYDALRAFEKEVRDSYVNSKKSPRIPSGRPGEKSPDLSNEQERVNYMAQIIEANSD
jgi:Skp family chaperone for outer membrane proteins